MRPLALLLVALLASESYCAVWGPKDSPSGVRGSGQRRPQVFELPADGDNIEEELQDVFNQASQADRVQRVRRQSADDNIGYTARLENDNHYQAVVHWTGHPSEDIFIVTRRVVNGHSTESWLWRSTDYGHTFVNETDKLPVNAVVEWYYISPYSEFLIFSDILTNRLYITQDEGETYVNVTIPFVPDQIRFQSTLAPSSDASPQSKYVLGYDSSAQSLWFSRDLGASWTRIGSNVPSGRYYWRRLDTDIEGDLSTVYYEQLTTNSNYSMLYTWNNNSQSAQLFSTSLGQFKSQSLVLEYNYIFVQKLETTDVTNLLSALWVSYNRNTEFKQTTFPIVKEHQHYSIIDASEGQVFIAVYHLSNTSNLYISEVEGVSYTLTLQDIVGPPEKEWVDGNPTIDVHVVEGIVGTYVANRHAVGSTTGSTVISFDKGGRWNLLSAPAVDRNGRPIVCAPPDCSLHLHMDLDAENNNYQSILSQDSAIGLIMAQGNLGSALTRSTRSARLYFSRDGGFTWAEVQTNLWEFQFAGLGSVVVAVRKRRLTSSVLWSCDEGATWTSTNFVDSQFSRGIVVIGMRTEAGEKSRHVTVFGYDIFGGFREWLVFDLNFTSVVPNQCDQDQDYYDWIPTDERPGSRCLLGEVVRYERRNASECCYVDPNYEKGFDRSACACAIEDFECDFGFERQTLNSPCIPYPGNVYPPDPPDTCTEGGTYNYSSGYRKIAGDRCVPGKEDYFFPVTRQCPVEPPKYLFIEVSTESIKANSPVTFNLNQLEGARLSTVYEWDFNDTSSVETRTGFDNTQGLTHTFVTPGVYTVRVTASNSGGSAVGERIITVYDVVKSVTITPPPQTFQNEVPASISLVFSGIVEAEYGTDMLGIIDYTWNFGDGSPIERNLKTTGVHIFNRTGTYTVRLTVHAKFTGDSGGTSQLSVNVYEANSIVDILSDAIQTIEGTNYITAKTDVSFNSRSPAGIDIPPDTIYTWHIVEKTSSKGVNRTSEGDTLNFAFPEWGRYLVSVQGRTVLGATFVGQLEVTVEYDLATTNITVAHVPTVRSGAVIEFRVKVYLDNTPYVGPLQLVLLNSNGSIVSSTSVTEELKLVTKVSAGRGMAMYRLVATNDVSTIENSVPVNVVEFSDYAKLTIQFSDVSMNNYESDSWLSKLSFAVQFAIAHNHNLSLNLIEMVGVRVVPQNDSEIVTVDSKDILKRQATPKIAMFVYVDINILPADLMPSSILTAQTLGHQIVTEAQNGILTVKVGNISVHISSAHSRTGGSVIIEPPIIVDRFDNQKYIIIGGSLGGFLVATVIITIVLVIIVYFYRRKYTRLNVRYSRLQQTPVRFSFTPGGEMVEEDEDDYDDDDVTSGSGGGFSVNI